MTTAREDRLAHLEATRIYIVATPSAVGPDWEARLDSALSTGLVGMVQVREKQLDDDAFVRLALRFRTLATRHEALLIVNDRVHLAAACRADGAHVGTEDLDPTVARRRLGLDGLLGLSTHDEAELRRARASEADHAGLGPCFDSTSKALDHPTGGAGLVGRCLPHAGDLPVFPIGGITPENVGLLADAGARRVAVGAGVLASDDPAEAVRGMHARLGG